jgi:hypothetical protein
MNSDINQEIANIVTPSLLAITLLNHLPAKEPVLITGAPGVGKTDIVKQVCHQLDADLIIFHPVVDDPIDYKGALYVNPNGDAHFVPIGQLTKLIDVQKLTVAFFDDLGQAPTAVQAACMQLFLGRQINGNVINDNVCFIAATNRKKDKSGVTGMIEALKSRFTSILELNPTIKDWEKWARSENMPLSIIYYMKDNPAYLEAFEPATEIVNTPNPRKIASLGRLINMGLPEEIRLANYAGAVGAAMAWKVMAYMNIFEDHSIIEEILENPDTAPIPDLAKSDEIYARCAGLVSYANEDTFQSIATYAKRLSAELGQKEYEVLLITDCERQKGEEISNTQAFINWSIENQDIIFQNAA